MTVYLFMHPLGDASHAASLSRLFALGSLRDELAVLPGVQVSPVPHPVDLEVEILNVIATDEGPRAFRSRGQRILVVRLCRNGERLDLVCSDSEHVSAERQAARRIRRWAAGEQPHALTTPGDQSERRGEGPWSDTRDRAVA
jgi:hypothetical protein